MRSWTVTDSNEPKYADRELDLTARALSWIGDLALGEVSVAAVDHAGLGSSSMLNNFTEVRLRQQHSTYCSKALLASAPLFQHKSTMVM
jgi:hypothetical protein